MLFNKTTIYKLLKEKAIKENKMGDELVSITVPYKYFYTEYHYKKRTIL